MSREIKFRLRDENNEIVGYEKWYQGEFNLECKKDYYFYNPGWKYSKDNINWNDTPISHRYKDQFTGLPDKNGKEIYENDILKYYSKSFFKLCGYYPTAKVEWHPETASFVFVSNGVKRHFNTYRISAIEKIGDFHQNPELLNN